MMSAQRHDETPGEREEIEALLPWYVTGKLEPPLAKRVTRYLAAHPELRHQVELIRAESDATIAGNEAIRPLGTHALDRLRATIEAHPRGASMGARFDGWRASLLRAVGSLAPSQLALAGAAAALVILVQAGAIATLMLDRAQAPVYETAAGPQDAGPSIEFLVGFRETATAAEISTLLGNLDGHIIDGPRSGLYRVRIPATDTPEQQRDAALRTLQQSGLIGIVLPGKK